MDIDAHIERHGHFLLFETKIAGKGMDLGQSIALSAQWKRGSTTIFQLCGKSGYDITSMAVYAETERDKTVKVGERPLTACNSYDVLYRARGWFCWASDVPIPTRTEWDRSLTRTERAQCQKPSSWVADYDAVTAPEKSEAA